MGTKMTLSGLFKLCLLIILFIVGNVISLRGNLKRNMGSQKRKLRLDTYHMKTVDRVTVSEESYTPVIDNIWLDLFKSPIQKQLIDIDSEIIMSDLKKNQLVNSNIDITYTQTTDGNTSQNNNNNNNIPQHVVKDNNNNKESKKFPKMKYNPLNFRIKQALLDKSKDIHQPAWTPELGAWKSMDVQDLGEEKMEGKEETEKYSMNPPMLSVYLQDLGEKRLADNHELNIADLYDSIKKGYTLKNISDKDSEIITDALRIAYVGLWGKTTLRSMDVSINRARGIAAVLGEIGADFDVMIAGILNELIYEVQFDDNFTSLIRPALVNKFGEDTVILTEKYLRLPKFMAKRKTFSGSQSEDQMQMLVALAEDYRTLYIRIADRVSTLRVLRRLPGLSEEDRIKIATESLHLYAPLAHKMGVMKVKGELEDLAFKYVDPEAFRNCKYTQTAANKAYHDSAAMIADILSHDEYLKQQNLNFRVTYRVKDKYQLYLKMKRKKMSLSEVRDALGLRVIIDTKRIPGESQEEYIERGNKNCYHLLGKIRVAEEWTPCGYKDYIAGAKENGYQSLHQYISNKATGTAVEIQIRTREMHISAEVGEAAHWFYKDQLYRTDIANSKGYKKAWRSPEQLEASSPAELIGLAKRQLNRERVFITLGDKATVLNLAKGSTALDAAFAIHGGLGLRTSEVIVNGKSAPLGSVLGNGDIITVVRNEISDVPNPPVSYLTMVKTDTAKRALRAHFKLQKKAVLLCMGMIQLASTISLNSQAILKRNFENLPAAAQLNRFAQSRWKSRDGKPGDISDVLMALGAAPKNEVASVIASLLDLPKEGISVVNRDTALRWIRMQSKHGFADRSTLTLLIDLMDLCNKGERSRLESRWVLLTGSNLVDTPSPYFSILQKKLTSNPKSAASA